MEFKIPPIDPLRKDLPRKSPEDNGDGKKENKPAPFKDEVVISPEAREILEREKGQK